MTELIAELQRRLDNWKRMESTMAATDHIAQADAAARIATFQECIEVALRAPGAGRKGETMTYLEFSILHQLRARQRRIAAAIAERKTQHDADAGDLYAAGALSALLVEAVFVADLVKKFEQAAKP